MSFEWTAQPLSIQSIAAQYTLPVVIRSAPGFRGSDRPVVLHSIIHVPFAYGRALKLSQSNSNQNGAYRSVDSETVAIPLKYPGYFECLPSRHINQKTGVVPDTSIPRIVKRMETDQRPQAFYVASPLRVYTLETNAEGNTNRRWHQIEAHQMILFDKLVQTEYTPMEEDSLTDDDYSYSWWLCFAKQLLNRTEYALKCILQQQQQQQQTCYLPCSSTDPVNLIPIGQRGSNNVNKLQAIHNLIEQFPLPVNVKLAQMPGSYAYQDFPGQIKLLGSRAEELAICASLSSTHLAAIPLSTPMKFVVAPLSSSSPQIQQILATCHIFKQSFDMQIRRILLFNDQNTASHRSRSRYPKIQEAIDQQLKSYKRSYSVEQRTNIPKDSLSAATTDEGYRSNSAAAKRRNYNRQSRAASQDRHGHSYASSRKRTSSTDEDPGYNTLVHSLATKKESSSSSSPPPPALPKKPPNFPYPDRSASYDTNSNIIDAIEQAQADGAILMHTSNELFLALPSDSRFT